jgi:hypothetical protein
MSREQTKPNPSSDNHFGVVVEQHAHKVVMELLDELFAARDDFNRLLALVGQSGGKFKKVYVNDAGRVVAIVDQRAGIARRVHRNKKGRIVGFSDQRLGEDS